MAYICRLCAKVSDHDMKVWLGMFFSGLSQTADVFCTEVHKQREKVRGERLDAKRNYRKINGAHAVCMWLL
jgi:hypothetical protein